jgi:hypothetical protein
MRFTIAQFFIFSIEDNRIQRRKFHGIFKVNGKGSPGKLAVGILVPVLGGSLADAFANRNT